MSASPPNPLRPLPGEVRVRLYGQGVGDCFLLAFPAAVPNGPPCYVVIDCGIAKSTPDRQERSRAIVADLAAATGNRIDVLVITHQHFDHLSGFQDAFELWQGIEVQDLYLPWTEKSAPAGEVRGREELRRVLDRAARASLEQLSPEQLAATPALLAEADFLGVGEPGGLAAAMATVKGLCRGEIRYLAPGEVFQLPGAASHGYVLGPPLPSQESPQGQRYLELLEDGREMYSYADFGLAAEGGLVGGERALTLADDRALPALAAGLLAGCGLDRDDDELYSPFAYDKRLDWDFAMASPFFGQSYGDDCAGENGWWRRVDDDWMAGMADLSLRAGELTNNLSLVLAFDLPDSDKMLLFPGDAQIGNWLSWHQIREWRYRDDPPPKNPPREGHGRTLMENLLGRVAFYKVGHHGSHNATPKGKGLELMQRDDLVAFVPVSVPVAQDLMGYCPMPFYPVLRALQQRTRGRVFLANGRALEPLPPGQDQQSLLEEAGLAISAARLPAKTRQVAGAEAQLEEEVPLFLELTLRA